MLEVNNFNAIRISLGVAGADPRLVVGRGRRSPRPSTTGRSSPRRTASSTSASSVPPRTGSATAASTSGSATRASSATSAAWRSPGPRSGASGWATSSWPAPSATSGTSRGPRRAWASCWTSARATSSGSSTSRSTSSPTSMRTRAGVPSWLSTRRPRGAAGQARGRRTSSRTISGPSSFARKDELVAGQAGAAGGPRSRAIEAHRRDQRAARRSRHSSPISRPA